MGLRNERALKALRSLDVPQFDVCVLSRASSLEDSVLLLIVAATVSAIVLDEVVEPTQPALESRAATGPVVERGNRGRHRPGA